jgi:hypothetical protein
VTRDPPNPPSADKRGGRQAQRGLLAGLVFRQTDPPTAGKRRASGMQGQAVEKGRFAEKLWEILLTVGGAKGIIGAATRDIGHREHRGHRGFAGLWGLDVGFLDARHLRTLGGRPRGHLVMAGIGYAGRQIRLRRTSRELDEIGKKLVFRQISYQHLQAERRHCCRWSMLDSGYWMLDAGYWILDTKDECEVVRC